MEIVQKRIDEIVPYENNPRVNDKAVQYVAESISEFGFKVPIVVDGGGTIIAGHTRYEAAKQLGMDYVPCIVAADLSEDQANAYRLADNRVSEKSKWDLRKLDIELSKIKSIDMKRFDFRLPKIRTTTSLVPREAEQENDEGYFGDERERTYNSVNLHAFDPYRADGFYQMPVIGGCKYVPSDLIGFKYVKAQNAIPEDTAVHFFIDDYQFERVWNNPPVYIGMLIDRGCECALSPDFSLYMDMPMAMKVWNVYRSRLVGQMMQDAGLQVIPTLQWAEPETFAFCFDGIAKGGTVATSNVGIMRDPEALEVFKTGMDEAIKRIQPDTILCYGKPMDGYDFQGVEVKYIEKTSKPGRWN